MHHLKFFHHAIPKRAATMTFVAGLALLTGVVVTQTPLARGADLAWDPPANYSAPLDAVWDRSLRINPGYPAENLFFDQIVQNQGVLRYCVVWKSSGTVTAEQRDQVAATLDGALKQWTSAVGDWGGWPYAQSRVEVTGWATDDASKLAWTDGPPVTVGDTCSGTFGPSLWLVDSIDGGAMGTGNSTGQTLIASDFVAGGGTTHILLHEFGHGFGLDDFYDYDPGVGGFIMMAGSAMTVTEFDAWMARNVWRHIADRNGVSGPPMSAPDASVPAAELITS